VFDGDIICTTNNEQIIKGSKKGNPVTYERKTAPKSDINKDNLWEADIKTFGGKIGFITNNSSSLYSTLANYKPEDEEYRVIQNRIKILTSFQSQSIDAAKGIKIMDFPEWWVKFQKTDDEKEKVRVDFQNKIMSVSRPYFFRWLYEHYNKDYKKYIDVYDTHCISTFKITLEKLLGKREKTEEEKRVEFYYHKYSKLEDSPSVVNKICHIMEKEVKTLKNQRNDMIYNFPVDKEKFKKIKELYSKWKLARKNYDRENSEILAIAIRRDADSISIKTKEIGMLAMNTSINFAISVFPEQVEFLYFTNKIKIPILDECGEIMFSGYNYSLLDFEVEKNG
jgi:hypothetical protein